MDTAEAQVAQKCLRGTQKDGHLCFLALTTLVSFCPSKMKERVMGYSLPPLTQQQQGGGAQRQAWDGGISGGQGRKVAPSQVTYYKPHGTAS